MTDTNAGEQHDTNTKALISMILGIISIVTVLFIIVGFIIGIVGLIFGIIAIKEIKVLQQRGRKMAIAGITCSSISLVLLLLLAVLFMTPMQQG